MDRRIETRVVDTGGAAATTLIQKDACEVYWIMASLETPGTQGLLQIYDGFDVAGKLQWQHEPGYEVDHNFIPPIPCEQGLTVYNDSNIACYTIGYRPRSWNKPKP